MVVHVCNPSTLEAEPSAAWAVERARVSKNKRNKIKIKFSFELRDSPAKTADLPTAEKEVLPQGASNGLSEKPVGR